MTKIISNDNFKIIKNNNKFIIYFASYSESLIKSLTKTGVILGTTVTSDYKTLMFKSITCKPFNKFKEYIFEATGSPKIPANLVAKMAADLGRQFCYLMTKYNVTIMGFNMENVVVLNDIDFIYLSSEFFREVNVYDETIMVTYPVSPSDFYIAPELLEMKEIPCYIHFKTGYFSFGCIILYALTGNNDFYDEYLKEEPNVRHKKFCEYLNKLPIKNTKLFGLVERCLVEEPENRSIIFI